MFGKYTPVRLSLKYEIILKNVLSSGLKSYGGRNPLDFEAWKIFLADETVIVDLANRTAQKWQQTWKSDNTIKYGSH